MAGVTPRYEEFTGADPLKFVVAELRAKGMSTREIAAKVGADQSTVVRDLKRGDALASPEPTPPARTGPDDESEATAAAVEEPEDTLEPPARPKVTGRDG